MLIFSEYFEIINKCPLFKNLLLQDMQDLLLSADAKICHYQKNNIVLHAGAPVRSLGVMLKGTVTIARGDAEGKINIINSVDAGDIFGEVFVCAGIEHFPVTVIASAECSVMFIDIKRILHGNDAAFKCRDMLIENLMRIIAVKNLTLSEKVNCLGQRSIREKVLYFLGLQMEKAGKNPFIIEYSRAEMADYLCVDRSALSIVLGKMQDEGVIRFDRNKFQLMKMK